MPTADHTPSATTPLLHPRTGMSLAEEFLISRAKHTPPPLTPVLTTPPHVTGVANMGMAPTPPIASPSLPPPPLTHKRTPTIIQALPAQQTQNSLPTPIQLLPNPSLTVSLPRFFSSVGRTTPTTHHNHHPPPTVSLSQPPSFIHPLPPSSLPVINNNTRKRPIPAISTPPVAMTPGKNPTPQHPTAAMRSSVGVIATGNRRPETYTRPRTTLVRGNISSGDHFHNIQFPEVVGVAQGSVGQLTPPKLRRFSHLPTLSASAQLHAPLVMPKLHRLTTPSFSSRGPASLAGSTSMPLLRPLSLENGYSSSAPKHNQKHCQN
ncbi:hypothetical protein GBAR_LOCUS9416 [Geodia barretti]|uniref:Uncharacterized protein n=2 Tax=Geodia barretti TaxID=519541 RepID=A0AA35RRR6_GEOBA|nr:hypothetical protein GBAR_LOCUS9416 [Geodia barretti]